MFYLIYIFYNYVKSSSYKALHFYSDNVTNIEELSTLNDKLFVADFDQGCQEIDDATRQSRERQRGEEDDWTKLTLKTLKQQLFQMELQSNKLNSMVELAMNLLKELDKFLSFVYWKWHCNLRN